MLQNSKTKKQIEDEIPVVRRNRSNSEHVVGDKRFIFGKKTFEKNNKKLILKYSSAKTPDIVNNNLQNVIRSSTHLDELLSSGKSPLKNNEKKLKKFVALAEESADLTDSSSSEGSENITEWRKNRKYSIAEKFEQNMKRLSKEATDEFQNLKKVEEDEEENEGSNKLISAELSKRGSNFSGINANQVKEYDHLKKFLV